MQNTNQVTTLNQLNSNTLYDNATQNTNQTEQINNGMTTSRRQLYSNNDIEQHNVKDNSPIQNKQMMILPTFNHNDSSHKIRSKRIKNKQYDIPKIIPIKHKTSTLYKTTIFRGGQFVNNAKPKVKESELLDKHPQPRIKRKFKNYFYEELAKKRSLKKQQHQLYKPSNTLYKELTDKCNETYRNYFTSDITSNSSDKMGFNFQKGNNKEQIVKKYESSWLINRKFKDKIPLIFPIRLRDNNLFSSKSEETRHDKMNDELLKIKYLLELESNSKKRKEIIVEYLKERNIEPEHITETSVQNFINFIQSDFRIDIHKTLKENIITGMINGNVEYKPTFVTEKGIRNVHRKIQSLITNKKSKDIEIKINKEPLDTCLEAQTNLTWNKPHKTDKIILNELHNELEQIKEESRLNKEIACRFNKGVKCHNRHFPTQDNFYAKPIADLRLGYESFDEFDDYNEAFAVTETPKPKSDLNAIVQRLYYSNIEKHPNFYLNIYKKKGKLLEYIMLERTKNKINYEQFKSQYNNIV